jgi:hypothetical protein
MLRYSSSKVVRSLLLRPRGQFSEGAEFLGMVEKYFDKAGQHTSIRADILNFYKRADNVVKFNLTLTRGTPLPTQTTTPSRSSPPTAASTRPTNSPPRAAPATLRMLILPRSRPSPV